MGTIATAALMAAAGTSAGSAGAAGLAASWQLNEGAGTSFAYDSTSHNNDGRVVGARAGVPGVSGTAYHFALPSIVTVPDRGDLNPGSARITVSMWLRSTGLVLRSGGPLIDSPNVAQKGKSSTRGGNYKIELKPSAGGANAVVHCSFRGSAGTTNAMSGVDVVNGAWHRVSCTRTGSTVVLSVDGRSVSRRGATGSIRNNDPFTIGAKGTDGEDQFTGDVDDVSVIIG